MDHDDVSPAPGEGPEATGSAAHSGSRWEPAPGDADDAEPDDAAAGENDNEDHTAVDATPVSGGARDEGRSAPRPRRRGLRVAAGIVAAVVLAGGGFGAGLAVGDDGPGPAAGHHRDHDRGGPDDRTGQNTVGGSGPIVGGPST